MKAKGIASDTGRYNIIMKAHRNANQFEEALALFRQMPRDGVQPDVITYTIMIDACARRADPDLAVELLLEMEERPDRIAPNEFIYGCVINACAKALQGKRALALFREMQEEGLRPNVTIYTSTIDALHQSRDDDTALVELYEEMKAKGVKPVAATYVAAIKAYARRSGMPDRILETGRKLIAVDGSVKSLYTLRRLLSAAIETEKYQDGIHFFNQALIHDIEPVGNITNLAATCAAEVGDLTTLQIYLEYVLEAEGKVEEWMPTMAFKAVDRARTEAREKKRRTGEGLGKKEAEAIEKLRTLAVELWRETAGLRRIEGRVALGSRADGGPSPKKGTKPKKRI